MEQDDNVRREAGEAAGLPSDSDKEAQVRTKDTKALSAAMTVVCRVDRKKGDAYGLQDERDDVDDVVVSGLQCSDSVCRQHKRTQADGGMDLIMGAGVYSITQGRPGPSECDARRCAERASVLVPYRPRRDDGVALIRLGGAMGVDGQGSRLDSERMTWPVRGEAPNWTGWRTDGPSLSALCAPGFGRDRDMCLVWQLLLPHQDQVSRALLASSRLLTCWTEVACQPA